MKKYLNGEVFFVLFMFGGVYKNALSFLPSFIDITIVFMLLSIFIGVRKVLSTKVIDKVLIAPFLLYAGLVFLCIISFLYVDKNPYSLEKTLRLIVITGWAYIGPFLLIDYSNPKKSLKRVLWAMIFVGVTIGFISIFEYVTNAMPSKTATAFGSENYLPLGRVTAIASLLLMCYYLFEKSTKKTFILTFLTVPFTIYALFISGGRMPVIAFITSLAIILALGASARKVKNIKTINFNKKIVIYAYIGLWVSPVIIYLVTKSNFFTRFLALFQEGGGASASGRITNYYTALDMILESKLMGMGIGGFLSYTGGSGDRGYPHNIILEITAELGVLGLIIFLLIIAVGLLRFFNYFNKNFYSTSVFALFVFFLINSMVSGDLNDNRFLFFSIALLSLSGIFFKTDEKTTNQSMEKAS